MKPSAETSTGEVGPEPAAPFPPLSSPLLTEIFQRSARCWPNEVAWEVPPGSGRPDRCRLTYAELDEQSNRVARAIVSSIRPDSVVALRIPRASTDFAVAQLAVLKAGGAYTCIDASFPDRQVAEILSDSGAELLLVDAPGSQRAREAGWEVRQVLSVRECIARSETLPSRPAKAVGLLPSHLAYVIYTSGTTGRPKGVMIEHASVANLVESDREEFSLQPGDRVAQGSSAAYDSSVEEIWLAWGSGATAVVMDEEAARLGPDLIPWLQRESITVLCPPPTLLRTTGCERPWEALPRLHLLYVGGEALTSDVADRWGRGRVLVNGYGPTECTVTSVRGRIEPEMPITIGRPVPGFTAWVLDADLKPVPDGTEGELCLGGIGLARGYRNRPELTAEKFPTHPQLGRLYRTGDLVSRGPDGVLSCHGRVDAQVKVRGYRIELEAIEARLSEFPGVRAAACAVRGDGPRQHIVAYAVAADPSSPPTWETLRSALEAVLPPYMVPARLIWLEDLPRTVGGKIHRRALPEPGPARENTLAPSTGNPQGGLTPLEQAIAQACAGVLNLSGIAAVPVDSDFFSGLGGDSLTAALWVSRLREIPATASLTVRDIYELRSIAALARRASEQAARSPLAPMDGEPASDAPSRITAWHRFSTTLLQATSIAGTLMIFSPVLYLAVFEWIPWLVEWMGWVPFVLSFPGLMFLGMVIYTPFAVGLAVGLKWLLIGKYRAGREPVWGSFYLRHWTVQQAVRRIPWGFLEGTEFLNLTLRALGARVGRRVHVHRGVDLFRGGWDLLQIGDDVTLSQEAALRLVELEDRHLVMGPVVLEDGATLEIRAGVGSDTRVGAGASITALSSLPRGGRIPAGERWDGIPARSVGKTSPRPEVMEAGREMTPMAHALVTLGARLASGWLLAIPMELVAIAVARWSGLDVESTVDWMAAPRVTAVGVVATALTFLAPVPLSLVLEALICRALGQIAPGVVHRYGWTFVRIWLKTGLVQSAGNWLYGTLFWPWWLRAAGARLGRDCEVSTIIDVVPEMVDIGAGSFLADGIYLAGPRIHQGTVTLAPVRLSERTFLGNGVVVPAGETLPPDVLLGVLTVADSRQCRPGSSWFGHPAFELPRREVMEMDVHLTHAPSVLRRANRLFWEGLRFLVPFVPAAVFPLWCGLLAEFGGDRLGLRFLLISVPVATAIAGFAPCVFVIALKWLLLGRVRPGVHPLWSCWASRWDFVCLAWSLLARDAIGTLDGTLLQAWLLRLLGVSVGRGVVLGPGFAQDIPDPDMLHLGDGATVDGFFQAHTFEDRVLKIDHVSIGAGASIGNNAVLLYGSDIGAGSRVEPHSVVMKRERLLPGMVYVGCPTRRLR